jgi:hypothetical protein
VLGHNPCHLSLKTHKEKTKQASDGEEIFEAPAENKTPGAKGTF